MPAGKPEDDSVVARVGPAALPRPARGAVQMGMVYPRGRDPVVIVETLLLPLAPHRDSF